MTTSDTESEIRSRVRCSNIQTVVCIVVCVLRSWVSTKLTLALSLVTVVFVLVWKSSSLMSVLAICLVMESMLVSSLWIVVVTLSSTITIRRYVLKSELAVLVLRLVWKVLILLSRRGTIRLSS